MVLDSSALLAILLAEPDRQSIENKLPFDRFRYVSAVTLTEASNVIFTLRGLAGVAKLDALIESLSVQVIPVDREQAILARVALRDYGRGRHKAKLNLGDAFTYALARQLQEPILFKGNDFGHTDALIA
jgi:ribonuclease VapC